MFDCIEMVSDGKHMHSCPMQANYLNRKEQKLVNAHIVRGFGKKVSDGKRAIEVDLSKRLSHISFLCGGCLSTSLSSSCAPVFVSSRAVPADLHRYMFLGPRFCA